MGALMTKLAATITYMGNKYVGINDNFAFLQTIFNIVSWVLVPLFIAVAAAGSIYAVVLGVNLARAADAEARQNAKTRLIWAIVGLVSIIVLILLINWICTMVPGWVDPRVTVVKA